MNRFLAPPDQTPNAFGGWFEHVAAFERLVRSLGPERALVIEYEEMHADLRGCLARLAALLGGEAEARLRSEEGEAIERALQFDAMKVLRCRLLSRARGLHPCLQPIPPLLPPLLAPPFAGLGRSERGAAQGRGRRLARAFQRGGRGEAACGAGAAAAAH